MGCGLSGTKIVIELPFAPSVNRLWRVGKNKRFYKTKAYEEWLGTCSWLIAINKLTPILGNYRLTIEATRPDKRKRDIDNFIKAVSDLLQTNGIIEDDCLCEEVIAKWVKSGPPMLITVEKIDVV